MAIKLKVVQMEFLDALHRLMILKNLKTLFEFALDLVLQGQISL